MERSSSVLSVRSLALWHKGDSDNSMGNGTVETLQIEPLQSVKEENNAEINENRS